MSSASSLNAPEGWADRLVERAPRVALLLVLTLAWAMTLAWPLPSAGTRQLVAGQPNSGDLAGYPLRLTLPEPVPASIEDLALAAERHPNIAALDMQITEQSDGVVEGNRAPVRTGFAAAFAAFLEPDGSRCGRGASATQAVTPNRPAPGEVLPLDYDLAKLMPSKPAASTHSGGEARYNSEDGSLTVTKQLLVDGKSRGNATIRIEEGAQILIATASVADALGDQVDSLPRRISGALATRTGFIPFHELRGAGIAVEYDPVTDRVSLSTNS